MKIQRPSRLATLVFAASALSLGAAAHAAQNTFSQDSLPDAVKVPAGNLVAWETVGMGHVTYECKRQEGAAAPAWAFAGPDAVLNDRAGKPVGKYWGPPATWEAMDGSKITGKELATAPSGAGNLPYQLVQANPATGDGALKGVTYIQRVALKGGVAPQSPCGADNVGARENVGYQADYIFWKAS